VAKGAMLILSALPLKRNLVIFGAKSIPQKLILTYVVDWTGKNWIKPLKVSNNGENILIDTSLETGAAISLIYPSLVERLQLDVRTTKPGISIS
jgi:hypothetical protein